MEKNKQYNLAVVGATGAVGREMIKMLEIRQFPVKSIKFFASSHSVGKKLKFNNKEIRVELLDKNSGQDIDIALFSAGAKISKIFAPYFVSKNCYVIDNSSAWRMDSNVPLIVPEVNSNFLNKKNKLIANPNCSTIQMVVVLKPIYDITKIKRVIVSTYQAVSGAGQTGIKELSEQINAWSNGKKLVNDKFQYQIAFNLIPHIDVFTDNGYTKEEMKMVNETKKILNDDNIQISATCVRVPVFRAHSESVWIETEKNLDLKQIKNVLSKSVGVCLIDNPKLNKYPMPIIAENKQNTFVGRLRKDISINKNNALTFWIVSDNLLKGAALNAVQIAEKLVSMNLV